MNMHLKDMDTSFLIRPEGHECSCGRTHTCGLDFFKVGAGAVETLPEALEKLGCKKPFVVLGRHTKKAAGDIVEDVLKKHNIP